MEFEHDEVGTMEWMECSVRQLELVDMARSVSKEAKRGGIGYGNVGGGDAGGAGGNCGLGWMPDGVYRI